MRSHFLGRFEGNWACEVRRGLDPSSLPYIESSREGKGREEEATVGREGGRRRATRLPCGSATVIFALSLNIEADAKVPPTNL